MPPASLARVRRRKIADFGRPQARKEVAVTRALLQAVEGIRAIIEEHAEGAEANRRLSDAVYDAMDRAGLFAMLAPKAYGGLELHPVEAMRVWEAVARIDTAAAWNLVMNQAISAYAAWLPAEGARELFRDGPPTTAGALHPPAAATRVDGGWRLTGRVPFASGCHDARWLAMSAAEMDGDRPKLDPATGMPGSSACSSRAPGPRSWTRGTPSACAAPGRPTSRCATCSCRTG